MEKRTNAIIVWEWAVPLLLIVLSAGLVEVGHLLPAWWRWLVIASGWATLWSIYAATWRRWRRCEVDRVQRERLPRGHAPSITLIAGEDLACGQVLVVNDRGFAVAPEHPFPPPGNPGRFIGRVGDDGDLMIDLDGMKGP